MASALIRWLEYCKCYSPYLCDELRRSKILGELGGGEADPAKRLTGTPLFKILDPPMYRHLTVLPSCPLRHRSSPQTQVPSDTGPHSRFSVKHPRIHLSSLHSPLSDRLPWYAVWMIPLTYYLLKHSEILPSCLLTRGPPCCSDRIWRDPRVPPNSMGACGIWRGDPEAFLDSKGACVRRDMKGESRDVQGII